MICSDFHPIIKIMDTLKLDTPVMDYFSTDVFEGEMAHARFYEDDIRRQFPKCLYRRYTISEIINSIIGSGFILKRFDEHPEWEDEKLHGEFTEVAVKHAVLSVRRTCGPYQPWTNEEDQQLICEYSEGKTLKAMSEIHNRTQGAIQSRLKKLRLI